MYTAPPRASVSTLMALDMRTGQTQETMSASGASLSIVQVASDGRHLYFTRGTNEGDV